jgi:hypothetical protein
VADLLKRTANETQTRRQMASIPSARPSSDLIQRALDWLFEQPEALAYDRAAEMSRRQAALGQQEE